eukprot:CAMPEP_0196593128 /NCGR_PEP_ID=MMETSP1081-20130531/74750_1 /TAXON_ID=36882 /ORGANISM="Pyramimonas amylifera, Strain CCMP720" /LENGTH=499 /DNA_ID=CAMNT_0041917015 /DNA_START=203 /DNA_END=1702 /DNA_ORIENTATION=+
MHAPMLFFESTPSGRILNRFTTDTDNLDFVLVTKVLQAVASAGWLITSTVVMSSIIPFMLVPLSLVIFLFFKLYNRFVVGYAQLQRLDSNSRSPVLMHLRESFTGAPVIRASRLEEEYIAISDQLTDLSSVSFHTFNSAGRWFAIRLESMGAFILCCVGVLAWYFGNVSGSFTALALIWSLHFTLSLTFITVSWSEVDSKIISAERVQEYCEISPEAAWETDGAPLPLPLPVWPPSGQVEFRGCVLTYRPSLPPALKGFTTTVLPGQHVGIVGRTGAGKSTIAVALFRLRELSEGSVRVDGQDLSCLGLNQVRGRNMCIIPQEPLMLSGTLRRNLDPFDEHADIAILAALERVQMGPVVQALPMGLDEPVQDEGGNWSAGEKQLLCFARVLLRRPKILLLDEATASVDHSTDAKIQTTLRSEFRKVTLLTVAHRLNTVMDYDRIVVMGNGKVVEEDNPLALLKNTHGELANLVNSLGEQASTKLKLLAENRRSSSDYKR